MAAHFDSGTGLSILVPCFNELDTIEPLLEKVRATMPDAELIVVDDGSTDGSDGKIRDLADRLQLKCHLRGSNGGKGVAIRDGLSIAGGQWIAIQDADLEYDPEDLRALYREARLSEDHRAVYGSRYLHSGRSPGGAVGAYWVTRFHTVLQWLLYGRWLTDPLTCYKLLPAALFRRLQIRSSGFELCAEINAKLFRLGVPIREIGISYRPRGFAEGKKIGALDFFRLVISLVRWRLARMKLGSWGKIASPFYIVARLGIGSLLMVAGAGKLVTGGPVLVAGQWVLPEAIVAAYGVAECLVGWLVLTFIAHRPLRHFLMSLFCGFLALLVLQWFRGETHCRCLGDAGLPIAMMVGVDMLALVLLVVQRNEWDCPGTFPQSLLGEVARNTRYALPAALVVLSLLIGSPHAAIEYLAGHSVIVNASDQFAGEVAPEAYATATYRLKNVSNQPVRVLGARSSCRCVAIDDLPLTLQPLQTRPIRVRLLARTSPGVQRESAELVFDDSTPRLTLGVTALVHPDP